MTVNARTPAYSRYALALLLTVNLNRLILSAIFTHIKVGFPLSDTALGFLGSAFMTCDVCSTQLLQRRPPQGICRLPAGSASRIQDEIKLGAQNEALLRE